MNIFQQLLAIKEDMEDEDLDSDLIEFSSLAEYQAWKRANG